jgi:hypothetical protein
MRSAIIAFGHLLCRAWNLELSWRSTSTLSIVLEVVAPFCVVVLARAMHGGRLKLSKPSLSDLRKSFFITLIVIVLIVVVVFVVAIPVTIYRDHRDLVQENQKLREQKANRVPKFPTDKEVRTVYKPFRDSYYGSYEWLGAPHRYECPLGAYEALYEHAYILWIRRPFKWFILGNDGSWEEREDREDKRFDDEKYLETRRSSFGPLPKGLKLPKHGIARYWLEKPEYWRQRIGFREWDCGLLQHPVGNTSYQEFDGGYIIGPFHVANDYSREDGRVYILLKQSMRYASKAVDAKPSHCAGENVSFSTILNVRSGCSPDDLTEPR